MNRRGCASPKGCGCSLLILAIIDLLVTFLVLWNAASITGFIAVATLFVNAVVFIILGRQLRRTPSLITEAGKEGGEGEESEGDEEGEEEDEEGEEEDDDGEEDDSNKSEEN